MKPDYAAQFERWAIERMSDIKAACKYAMPQRCYPMFRDEACKACFDVHCIEMEASKNG